ncbi:MAG: hypothetical protein KGZ69_09875 [Methylomonas sp.]|nr:hypothetical protein [Methylomonas sp.]
MAEMAAVAKVDVAKLTKIHKIAEWQQGLYAAARTTVVYFQSDTDKNMSWRVDCSSGVVESLYTLIYYESKQHYPGNFESVFHAAAG